MGAWSCAVAQSATVSEGCDGDGSVTISGEMRPWHKITLTLKGPFARERDDAPNPFMDYRMTVTFAHESGAPKYSVPGYFAADGDAGNTSATSGACWRAHLSPDKSGEWSYSVSFARGPRAAIEGGAPGEGVKPFDGARGTFDVAANDKAGRDFRAKGRLRYVGKHYLQFAGSGEYFLKAGADAPETLLAYADFDDTAAAKKNAPLKTWAPHVRDFRPGDPTWKGNKGQGLIGALNYLAAKGLNAFSFLSYNAGGDGDNVWPFVARDDKFHYDCSKLDQWAIAFDHATSLGLYCHFKLQETENDDGRHGNHATGQSRGGPVPAALDGGDLGPERKLYLREIIARYGHLLALNWNLGEENTQSVGQQRAMARFIQDTDPYGHHIVLHTFPNWQDRVYPDLLGGQSALTGASLQNSWSQAHQRTLKWVIESAKAGKPWVVANDEQNPAELGVPPDPGYRGFGGEAIGKDGKAYTAGDVRRLCLWGTLMAGGAGVEYYFGYKLPENDLACEDFRSRDTSWDYCRMALEFFSANKIPFWEMGNADALVGNTSGDNSKYCFAKRGDTYLVFLPQGGTTDLDLGGADGAFRVWWFNPRDGGALRRGAVTSVAGGGPVSLGPPPEDTEQDWLVVVQR